MIGQIISHSQFGVNACRCFDADLPEACLLLKSCVEGEGVVLQSDNSQLFADWKHSRWIDVMAEIVEWDFGPGFTFFAVSCYPPKDHGAVTKMCLDCLCPYIDTSWFKA